MGWKHVTSRMEIKPAAKAAILAVAGRGTKVTNMGIDRIRGVVRGDVLERVDGSWATVGKAIEAGIHGSGPLRVAYYFRVRSEFDARIVPEPAETRPRDVVD